MNTQKSIVIIGSNITSYLIAQSLSKAGASVTVVDSSQSFSKTNSTLGLTEVEMLPSESEAFDALAWFENQFEKSATSIERETSAATLVDGAAQAFLGFGDSQAKSVTPLSSFNVNRILQTETHLHELIEETRQIKNFNLISHAEITKIDDLDQKVKSITVNGNHVLTADYFLFTEHPKNLLSILPADAMSSRAKNRILKTATWAEIRCVFEHAEPRFILDQVVYMLPPSIRNEPFVGQFQKVKSESTSKTLSVWQSYLPIELVEDPEAISATLKHIKKTLQKAFSTHANEFTKESFIVVNSDGYADFSWAKEGFGHENDLKNLFFCSPLTTPYTGLLASLVAAHSICLKIEQLETQGEIVAPMAAPSILSTSVVAEHGASC